jgi:phospholipase C
VTTRLTRPHRWLLASVVFVLVLTVGTAPAGAAAGIHKIRHVVIIMQENRSFDNYFGTYPGADGIPGLAGNPGRVPCVPDPLRHRCTRPYHDSHDVDYGGPHDQTAYNTDYDGGRMDGFIRARENCTNALDPQDCIATLPTDMMGYHDQREIPNYWAYARTFVLQDHMFEPNASWSLPAHLFLVSECLRCASDPAIRSAAPPASRIPGCLRTSDRLTPRLTTPGPTSHTSSTATT